MSNIPRTTKEIADAYGIPTKDVSRTSDMFRTVMLTTSVAPRCESENATMKMTRPADVIPRLMNQFNFGDNRRMYTIKCNKLCKKLENCVELMGKTPVSVASVIMMIALDLTKQDVCKTCKISMPTLNKIDIIIKKYLEELDNGGVE
jgi:transcription initiation factor TFIIIB Brf1 subunit/transcription initiation factor TFIIB